MVKQTQLILDNQPHGQECFNSPYGHVHFPVYAETIGYTPGVAFDVQKCESDSVKMLSSAAKETGVWLLGGIAPFVEHDDVLTMA